MFDISDYIDAQFVLSAPSLAECPTWDLPECAFIGRSNVGKSSLINCLLNRKNIAKTSNTPGKTRLMNFYQIGEYLSLVDLPGYGYAKVSKTEQQHWQKHFEQFLRKRTPLCGAIHLIDGRHPPQANDHQMIDWLLHYQIPTHWVVTKADKVKRQELDTNLKALRQYLPKTAPLPLAVSAETGLGRDALWQVIFTMATTTQPSLTS